METKKSKPETGNVMPAASAKVEKNTTAQDVKTEEKRAEQPLTLSQILEKQLTEIKRKKQLADRRDIFLQKSEEIGMCIIQLEQEQAEGNFTTDNFSLIFAKKSGYRDDDAFKISNPAMMMKFLNVLQDEILEAIKGIESELLKDI